MSHALRSSPARSFPSASAVRQFLDDLCVGAAAAFRSVLLFAGGLVLTAGLVVLVQGDLRARLVGEFPAFLAWARGGQAAEATVATAEVELAEAEAEALRPVPLDAAALAQQRQIAQYLARRYRVANEAVRGLVETAYRTGHEMQLDPKLILAVMAIESSMNPLAESPVGAQGLMQVMTSVHLHRFAPLGGQRAALEPEANIRVGSSILKDLIERGGSVERGLQLYVGAGNLPDDGGYGARVLGERARIAMAAAGQVGAALAAASRSAAAAEPVRTVGEVQQAGRAAQPI